MHLTITERRILPRIIVSALPVPLRYTFSQLKQLMRCVLPPSLATVMPSHFPVPHSPLWCHHTFNWVIAWTKMKYKPKTNQATSTPASNVHINLCTQNCSRYGYLVSIPPGAQGHLEQQEVHIRFHGGPAGVLSHYQTRRYVSTRRGMVGLHADTICIHTRSLTHAHAFAPHMYRCPLRPHQEYIVHIVKSTVDSRANTFICCTGKCIQYEERDTNAPWCNADILHHMWCHSLSQIRATTSRNHFLSTDYERRSFSTELSTV